MPSKESKINRVEDLPKLERIQFHEDQIKIIEDTIYPARYNGEKEFILQALRNRIDDIISDRG